MNVLKEERVVVVAEQKPNCTDEEVYNSIYWFILLVLLLGVYLDE